VPSNATASRPEKLGPVQVSLPGLVNAKRLEFDSVIVLEPARTVGEKGHGLRALYVALTRCTRRLALAYRRPANVVRKSRASRGGGH
jgi:superfamily I DNA/RNA helicase